MRRNRFEFDWIGFAVMVIVILVALFSAIKMQDFW